MSTYITSIIYERKNYHKDCQKVVVQISFLFYLLLLHVSHSHATYIHDDSNL